MDHKEKQADRLKSYRMLMGFIVRRKKGKAKKN
jgi:hypothetical protein